ncbi:hypothetical protein TrCOL_g5567 [Triparma columacea]|uniref:WW domain-containing protein n=1 Tax=Triparma columacea TaxID=722753 RepID=A0A9W7FVH4_9STRA|nr:hypothetical protein TrCOL_g5567 [Triparma columacea]
MKLFRRQSKNKTNTPKKRKDVAVVPPPIDHEPLSSEQIRRAHSGGLQTVEAVQTVKSQTIIFSRTQSYPDDEEIPNQLRAVVEANPKKAPKPVPAKRKSSKKFDNLADTGDRSVWKETYHIRKQRYFYRNLATNRCVWDEPPSGTRHIWYLDDDTYEYHDKDGQLASYASTQLKSHVDVFFDSEATTTTLHNKPHPTHQPILSVASTFEEENAKTLSPSPPPPVPTPTPPPPPPSPAFPITDATPPSPPMSPSPASPVTEFTSHLTSILLNPPNPPPPNYNSVMATSAKLLGKVLQLTRKSVIQELGDEEILQEVSLREACAW